MSTFFEKVCRKIINIQRFGIRYELENLLIKAGVFKERSLKSLLSIQKFYEKLDPNEYPHYLKEWYYRENGRELNLEDPVRFTEKIQWLKLYDSTLEKTKLADKYLVREWVTEKIGEKYLIPLYGVWNRFDDINFDELPESFVLKCNHGCAMNALIKDKNTIDKQALKRTIDRCY